MNGTLGTSGQRARLYLGFMRSISARVGVPITLMISTSWFTLHITGQSDRRRGNTNAVEPGNRTCPSMSSPITQPMDHMSAPRVSNLDSEGKIETCRC